MLVILMKHAHEPLSRSVWQHIVISNHPNTTTTGSNKDQRDSL
ncbi:hypothetical protein BRADI_4g37028v3 [Brachypodium distachyon]|uniref:Uncharacterized protein n=1 Tax=Brachypodium distachyon TaxID=15368 RepID=A0A2K2CSS6_BRADI|nr:hypothetical protein BRADI_4g37028v3 [Brachypodium distachyon]